MTESNIGRCGAFKIFHIVREMSSTDLAEKVFMFQTDFEEMKRNLHGQIQVVGLVGPCKMIYSYLENVQKVESKFEKTESIMSQMEVMKIQRSNPIQFTFLEEEVASLYTVKLPNQTPNNQTIFLCFVTGDEFYYKRPMTQNSIKYMLIRFMGDLCSHINILYDDKMQREFEKQGCPYSASKKKICMIKMVKRTQRDIKQKEIPCDFSGLYNFNPNYSEKLILKTPVHSKNLICMSKALQKDYRMALVQKMKKDQLKLWELIFQKNINDYEKILLHIGEPNSAENIAVIKQIVKIYEQLKQEMYKFGCESFKTCVKIYQDSIFSWSWGCSSQFKQNVYRYIIGKHVLINPETKTFSLRHGNQYQTICYNVLTDIYNEYSRKAKIQYNIQTFYTYMGPSVWQIWASYKDEIAALILDFFPVSEKIMKNKKISNEETIDINVFEVRPITSEKQQRIVINQSLKMLLTQQILEQKLGSIIPLHAINKIQMFDLKNSQNSKLVVISLERIQKNLPSLILLSYSNNNFKFITSYKKSGILFTFHTENQKAYIFNNFNNEIISFKIDSLQRIVQEKIKSLKRRDKDATEFGVSISPSETVFFLDSSKTALFSVDLTSGEQITYDRSNSETRYLTPPGAEKYTYLRTFNQDLYVLLGNKQTLDVFKPNPSTGKLMLKSSIKLDITFIGVNVFDDNLNQYFIVADSNKPRVFVYQNLNCSTMFKTEQQEKNAYKGNPVLDIFYGAKQKFGIYKNYTTVSDNPKDKILKLHHVFQRNETKQKIQAYSKELFLEGHEHFFNSYPQKEGTKQMVSSTDFLSEVQTRIPIQLCTLENSNIVPLIRGKLENYHFFKQMSIAERSKIIEFGIVEELLNKRPDKRVIVVSIMGAQSTGKSYLMNRLFGTRFTVSSARCTIGIWLSLVETQQINYLLMDCQGLFAVHREVKQQQKLIRILTSISDYTLLNQNMSMSNRSLVQLLQSIAQSVKNSVTTNTVLYKGQMFVIVRDVKSSEAQGIQNQFQSSLKAYQKNRQSYISQLFENNIILFSVEHFQKREFNNDISSIREHIREYGLKRPLRTSRQILQSLKVIVNQLTCDDSKSFQQQMSRFKVQKSKEQILKLWCEGINQTQTMKFEDIQLSVNQNIVVINIQDFGKESSSCIQKLDDELKEQVTKKKKINTTNYRNLYENYNKFLQQFFQKRFKAVQQKIELEKQTSLRGQSEQSYSSEISSLQTRILSHKQKLRLCLQKCSDPNCFLPCTSRFNHKFDINSQKESLRVQRDSTLSDIKSKTLTEEQVLTQRKGIQDQQKVQIEQLQANDELKQKIVQQMDKNRLKNSLVANNGELQQKINEMLEKVSKNNKNLQIFTDETNKINNLYSAQWMPEIRTKQRDKIIENLAQTRQKAKFSNYKNNDIVIQTLKTHVGQYNQVVLWLENRRKMLEKQKVELENSISKNKTNIEQHKLETQKLLIQEQKKKKNGIALKQKQTELEEYKKAKEQILSSQQQEKQANTKLYEQMLKEKIDQSQVVIRKKQHYEQLSTIEKQRKAIKQQIEHILSSPLYSNNADEYLMQEIAKLNKMNIKLKININRQKEDEKKSVVSIQEVKKKLQEQKFITQTEDIDKLIEQIQDFINRQERKCQYLKGQKLEQSKNKILELQQDLLLITDYQKIMKEMKKVQSDNKQFKQNLQQFKSLFKDQPYKDALNVISKLIHLKYQATNSEGQQNQGNKHFLTDLINDIPRIISSEINDESKKLIVKEKIQTLKTKLDQKNVENEQVLEMFDNCPQQEIPNIEKRLKEIQAEIKAIQVIINHEEAINQLFKKHLTIYLQKQLSPDEIAQSAIDGQLSLPANPNFKIKTDESGKILEISGTIDKNFEQFSQNLQAFINNVKIKKNKLKIEQSEFKIFEKSKFSENSFMSIKQMICLLAQEVYDKNQKLKLMQQISQNIVKQHENVTNIDEKNWTSIHKTISQTVISQILSSIICQQKNKYKTQLDSTNSEITAVGFSITAVQKQIQTMEKKIKQMTSEMLKIQNNLKLLTQNIKALKETIKQIESQINSAISSSDQNKLEMDKLKELFNKLKDGIDSLEAQKKLKEGQLAVVEERKKVLEFVDSQRVNDIAQAWFKQFEQNFQTVVQIKSTSQKIGSNNVEINKLDENLATLSKVINGRSLEETNKKIEEIQKNIASLRALKVKIKQLANLKEKFELLTKRYDQISKSERSLCSCTTNHKCQQLCQAGCKDVLCTGGAGHKGHHMCKQPNHKCQQKCAVQKCQKNCNQKFEHSAEIAHSCHSNHTCRKKCKFCDKQCSKGQFDNHEDHLCKSSDGCQYKCLLCGNKCASKDHFHDDFAQKVQILEENKQTKQKKLVSRKLHLCANQHDCFEECNQKGICAYQYRDEVKKWNKNGCQRDYTYTQQIEARKKCSKKIPSGKLKHKPGECACGQKTHKCNVKCPDCGSFCSHTFGHQGKHKAQHRNQQNLLYAAEQENKQIKISKAGEDDFIFAVGDISLPTRCDNSCERKGRGHYHLIECKGGDKCLEVQKNKTGVKHSPLKYYPYIEKEFDMVLCKIYWEHWNFEQPVANQEFNLCNFICPYDHDGDKRQFFCTQFGLHSTSRKFEDHHFECGKEKKHIISTQFSGIQICFLIDVTGSMSRFIDQCKETVKQIVQKTSSSKKKTGMKFSVVGYRDHQMSKSKITMELKKLCSDKRQKLLNLPGKNFHNEKLGEAEFIQFVQKVEKKYQMKKGLENARAQFNEKQLFVLDYHYPFFFDIPTSQDMIGAKKILGLLNPLKLLLSALTGSPQLMQEGSKTLKQHIYYSLEQHYEEMQQEERDEEKKKQTRKLLEVSNFAEGPKTIQFLQNLEADGGGDPPEAVLDGMDQICRLSWSRDPSIIKYVFHIFDAPPHGRIFSQDNGDRYPDGCPCQKSHEKVIQNINKLGVNYVIYPLTPRVNGALDIFQSCGLNFKRKDINKDKPEDLNAHITQTICRNIEQNQIMIMREE